MKQKSKFLIKPISDKNVAYFPGSNQYVLMNPIEADILLNLNKDISPDSILKWYLENSEFSHNEIEDKLKNVKHLMEYQSIKENNVADNIQDFQLNPPLEYFDCCFYCINDEIVSVEYESLKLMQLIHPKMMHLSTSTHNHVLHKIRIYTRAKVSIVEFNGRVLGSWHEDDIYFLIGRLSMLLLNIAYNKKDEMWMSVLHASAISNGESTIVFCGKSGSGKSMAAALLLSEGYNLVSDDIVAIDESNLLYSFPAALSIKKSGFNIISKNFPRLLDEQEFYDQRLHKNIKYLNYLIQNKSSFSKAIIFIKYDSAASFTFKRVDSKYALIELVPESWISHSIENAEKFISWVNDNIFYRLIYAQNSDLFDAVEAIYNNEI